MTFTGELMPLATSCLPCSLACRERGERERFRVSVLCLQPMLFRFLGYYDFVHNSSEIFMEPPDHGDDDDDGSSFVVPVHRVTQLNRSASHPPASTLLTAPRDEMNRALDAFEREWAVPLMARRRLNSTPNLLFPSLLEDRPPLRTTTVAGEPSQRAVAANVKTVEIEWLDDDGGPAQSSAQPCIEDVTSSTDPQILNSSVHRQNVCVVEMPGALNPRNALTHACHRNLFNPHAPVITDVSTHIHEPE